MARRMETRCRRKDNPSSAGERRSRRRNRDSISLSRNERTFSPDSIKPVGLRNVRRWSERNPRKNSVENPPPVGAAVVVAKHEFVLVRLKILGRHGVVGTTNAAFHQG